MDWVHPGEPDVVHRHSIPSGSCYVGGPEAMGQVRVFHNGVWGHWRHGVARTHTASPGEYTVTLVNELRPGKAGTLAIAEQKIAPNIVVGCW